MGHKKVWSRALIAGIVAAAALTAGIAIGERHAQIGDAENRAIYHAVEEAGPVSFWAVVQKFSGPLEESAGHLSELMEQMKAQGLDAALEGFEPTAVLILASEPSGSEARGLIGLTVPARLEVKEPLGIKRVRFSAAASYVHAGAYEELAKVHAAVAATAKEVRSATTAWPVVLRLLNDPRTADVPKSELVVPLEDRGAGMLANEAQAGIRRAVEAASSVSYQLVTQKFEGSPEQIGRFLEEFMRNFTAQGLGDHLASRDVAPLAILHGNPDEEPQVGIEIGLPVKGAKVTDPLAMSAYEAKRAVSYLHRGPYQEFSAVHATIERTAKERWSAPTAFPVALRLFSDPRRVPAEDIETEVIVPLGG